MITPDRSTKRTGIPGRGEREGFRLRKLVAAYRVLFITEPGSYIEGTLVLHSGGSGGIRVRSTPLRIVERTISHREQSVLCLHIVCRTCSKNFFFVCVYTVTVRPDVFLESATGAVQTR